MNDYHNKKWDRKREKGEYRYILKYGALFWGVPLALIVIILHVYLTVSANEYISYNEYIGSSPFLRFTFISIFVFLIIGLINGKILWWMNERNYKKEKEK